jgi:hypothetical protein
MNEDNMVYLKILLIPEPQTSIHKTGVLINPLKPKLI